MATDTRSLKWQIFLDSNPEVLDDLTKKFREADIAKKEFASSLDIGLSVNLWQMAFDQIRRIPAAVAEAAKRGEEMAMRMASARRELEQFSGGAGVAAERLDELMQLADHPGWELPGLVKGAAALDKLTNGALSSGQGLQLVADVATGTGHAFDGLSVHVGNAYKALMSGANASGALQALSQMGAISAETQAQLEQLQKTGAKGPEVWAVLEDSLSSFNGELDRMRNTAEGVRGRIDNLMSQVLGRAAQAYLDRTQESAEALADTLEQMDSTSLEHLAQQFGAIGAGLNNAKEFAISFNAEFILVGKILAGLGLLAAGRKALVFAKGLRDMMRASSALSAALLQTTKATGASRTELMAHLQAQTQSTAASTRAAAAKQADTAATAANTTATVANTAAKVANARASGAAAAAGVAGAAGAIPVAAGQAGKAAQAIPAATANVGRLTTAFRGLGGAVAGVGRGLTALLGGPIGLVVTALIGVKALTDYIVDKYTERLERIDAEQNALVKQNSELSSQLRTAESLTQLQKVRTDTEEYLAKLKEQTKTADKETLPILNQLIAAQEQRLKLIATHGAEVVAENTELRKAADEEKRRNDEIAARLALYEKNKEQYAKGRADYLWDITPDREKLEKLRAEADGITSGYYGDGRDLKDVAAEARQLAYLRKGYEADLERASRNEPRQWSEEHVADFQRREEQFKRLAELREQFKFVSATVANADKEKADRGFALDQMREQLRADQARLAGNESLARSIEDQARLKRDIRELVSQTGVDEKTAADLAKDRLATEQGITKQKEAQRQRRELEDMLAQYAIDQARLAGKEKLASEWEDELRIKRDIRDIVERTGKSEQWAAAFAKDRLDTEKKLAAQKAAADGKGGAGGQMQRTVKTDARGNRLHFVDGEWLRPEDMSHAQRRATGTATFVRDGAAAVGMVPGWMDLDEDRRLRRNDYMPRPTSLSAALAAQLGVGAPAAAAQDAFPPSASAATAEPSGEKITVAAEGAVGRLEMAEAKTASAIEQLGQSIVGRFDQITGVITSIEARIDDLRN